MKIKGLQKKCVYFIECSNPLGSGAQEWLDFIDIYELVEKIRHKQQGKTICNNSNIIISLLTWRIIR